MSDALHPGDAKDVFEDIDARLNVFALANGMDLSKRVSDRRLEWFSDGLERAILIEPSAEGGFDVGVISRRSDSEEIRSRASVGSGLPGDDLIQLLASAIEAANRLA